jgi:hypothetical protein
MKFTLQNVERMRSAGNAGTTDGENQDIHQKCQKYRAMLKSERFQVADIGLNVLDLEPPEFFWRAGIAFVVTTMVNKMNYLKVYGEKE